jgi:hypothetical protein
MEKTEDAGTLFKTVDNGNRTHGAVGSHHSTTRRPMPSHPGATPSFDACRSRISRGKVRGLNRSRTSMAWSSRVDSFTTNGVCCAFSVGAKNTGEPWQASLITWHSEMDECPRILAIDVRSEAQRTSNWLSTHALNQLMTIGTRRIDS